MCMLLVRAPAAGGWLLVYDDRTEAIISDSTLGVDDRIVLGGGKRP